MPESSERGALTEAVYYIMLAVYKPIHSYGIIKYVEEISKGRVVLGAGTLYGALNTLVDKKWISLTTFNNKKEYYITSLGKEVIKNEIKRLEELINNGKLISGGEVHENN